MRKDFLAVDLDLKSFFDETSKINSLWILRVPILIHNFYDITRV